ncbi:hypothetical protein MHYP_G00125790 [Metynnis hypsauchen]
MKANGINNTSLLKLTCVNKAVYFLYLGYLHLEILILIFILLSVPLLLGCFTVGALTFYLDQRDL